MDNRLRVDFAVGIAWRLVVLAKSTFASSFMDGRLGRIRGSSRYWC